MFNINHFIPFLVFFLSNKVSWLGQKISGISFKYVLRIMLLRFDYFLLLLLMKINYTKVAVCGEDKKESYVINETLFEAIKYILCALVFEIFFDPQFERLFRPALIFSYILIARLMVNMKRFYRIFFMVMALIAILIYAASMLFLQTGGDLSPDLLFNCLFRNVFEHNLFFQNLFPN